MIDKFIQVILIFGAVWFIWHLSQWYLRRVRK